MGLLCFCHGELEEAGAREVERGCLPRDSWLPLLPRTRVRRGLPPPRF